MRDTNPLAGLSTRLWAALVVLASVFSASLAADAEERAYCNSRLCTPDLVSLRFGSPDGPNEIHARVGDETDVYVVVDVRNFINAVRVGVAVDRSKIEVLDVRTTSAINTLAPTYDGSNIAAGRGNIINESPNDLPWGFVCSFLFDTFPLPGVHLPRGEPVAVCKARIRVIDEIEDASVLEFADDLLRPGFSPPAVLTLLIGTIQYQPARVIDGTIKPFDRVKFRRGDVNGDGRFDITDPFLTANRLILGDFHQLIDCKDAFDADDDGLLTVTDPLRMLIRLFLVAPELPAPGASCGFDDDEDLGCAESNCED